MMYKIDLKDRKILYELDLNSRQPYSKIAKKVGLSKETINYRIKKLESQGYINGFYTIIDFSKLGYFSVRVYLKLIDTNPQVQKQIIEYLVQENTFYVVEIEGYIDIDFGFMVKSIYDFESAYLKFKKKFKKHIAEEYVSIFLRVHHFHRAYILNKKIDEELPEYFGGKEIVKHDNLDMNILKLLSKNANIPLIEIARELNTPPRTVAFRIKQLRKKGIIQGYRCIFNYRLYNRTYYKVDMTLIDLSQMSELINFARMHPNIVYVDETIGGSDFEFDVEIENHDKFLELIDDIRNKFPIVRNWKYFTNKRYIKLQYFPEI